MGTLCDCIDCLESETPCSCDCDKGETACEGCRLAYDALEEERYTYKLAIGSDFYT